MAASMNQDNYSDTIEIVASDRVSPPEDSTPPSAVIPLTFLDISWFYFHPVQRIMFYDFPHPVRHFNDSAVPALKRSLSAALARFYPLAGTVVCPPPPEKPYIAFSHGDSVMFTAAIATSNFTELTSGEPQDIALLRTLVSPLTLPAPRVDARVAPLIAIQVTLFPDSGVCIGIQYLHVAADGTAINHFLKTWASICTAELGVDPTCVGSMAAPVLDRVNVLKDPNGHEDIILKHTLSTLEDKDSLIHTIPSTDKTIATFTLTRAQIGRLKSWVLSNHLAPPISTSNLSTFVVASAYTWIWLIKSKEGADELVVDGAGGINNDVLYYLAFVADCRNRLEYPIPQTYFGNCLSMCVCPLKRGVLLGEHGMAAAAGAIGTTVKELGFDGRAVKGADKWIPELLRLVRGRCSVVSIAGSPRQRVYDTNFGWGRPRKCMMVHIDSGTFSLLDSRDEEGGVEIGVALTKVSMATFSNLFNQGLDSI